MTGEWLERTLRVPLHHDTFELFVAPAIADLQHQRSIAGYAAVWRSLLGACAHDAVLDAQQLLDDVGLMLGLITIQVCYYGGMLLLLAADVRAEQMASRLANGAAPFVALLVLGVIAGSTFPTLLCFWPPRRTLET